MSVPKVSVLMGVQNLEKYISQSIESVLTQTFTDFEFIILDDGSTDRTLEIIKEYAAKDDRIRYFSFPQKMGIAYGCNFTVEKSVGKYLARMDGDDLWEPEKLMLQVEYLDSHPECGVCFTQAKIIDETGKELSSKEANDMNVLFSQTNKTQAQWLHHLFTHGNCLCHPTSVIRKEVFDHINGYHNAFRQLPDFDMWMQLIQFVEFHIIEKPLFLYRWFENNTSKPNPIGISRTYQEYFQLYLHLFDHIPDDLFIESFSDLFICKDSQTEQELACEKAFLLYHHSAGLLPEAGRLAGLTLLTQLLNQDDTRSLLQTKYHFDTFDYVDFESKPIFYSSSYYDIPKGLTKDIVFSTATLFYSTGDSIDGTEFLTTQYQADTGLQQLEFQLPEGTTILRLDPLENHPCVVWYLAAEINGIPLRADPFNAQQEGIWYFDNDPQIGFTLEQPIGGTLKIVLGVMPLHQTITSNIKNQLSQVSVSKLYLSKFESNYQQQIGKLNEEKEQQQAVIDNLKEQLYAMTVDRDFNKQQLEAIRNTKAYRVYKKIRGIKK
ncbi:glycosyltransferase family 2 protein [Massilioclostridium coli]|uniref:glycosyltransferase family 2 protein n=1 Tax=Massilioclostridium coli TaxID=1870991 RepID=UPI0022E3168F|nr:glycosyltransferase family 2 protein [Massilioclostridium coli]